MRVPPGWLRGREPNANARTSMKTMYGGRRRVSKRREPQGTTRCVGDKYLAVERVSKRADSVFYGLEDTCHVPQLDPRVGGHVGVLSDLVEY